MRIAEIFESVQGEGYHAGTPATFVRLQGCDVGCPWCDTKETWDKAGGKEMSLADVMQVVSGYRPKHVVVTGGEPAMHADLEVLVELLAEAGYQVQIETSGTYKLPWFLDECWVTVSPKVGMARALEPETLLRAAEIKMPIGKEKDIEALLGVLKGVRYRVPIYLQPLSLNPKATALCIEAATAYGWKVSAQVHKYLGIR